MSDYAVGTDMNSETIVDAEDQLVVEKRKYYNFSLDKLEDLFTYAADIPANLLDNASEVLSRTVDTYVLNKWGEETKAGNWIGIDLVVVGSGQTEASIATSATGGTVTLNASFNTKEGQVGAVENPRDGATYHGGFISPADLYKGFRLRSTAAFVSPWYRISGITSTIIATLTEWDEATSGSDFEEGHTLRGLFGGDGKNFPKYGDGNAALTTMSSLGWEIQAAAATSVSATTIYDQVTLLAEALDDNEVPPESRHFTVLPQIVTQLRQSAEMQPTGIAEIYTGTVINGRAMRVGAFDIHSAAGARVSSRAGHSTATAGTSDADSVPVAGSTGYMLAANHEGFITFADKWSESRVVNAENQFARKYQGLFLFGCKVPRYRRKFGAVLFGSF
uniref:Putative structural protein n=1 Tax=viral metagenome TaxID=1070528 RepID=A0A6H1ZZE0_9ZZZZ